MTQRGISWNGTPSWRLPPRHLSLPSEAAAQKRQLRSGAPRMWWQYGDALCYLSAKPAALSEPQTWSNGKPWCYMLKKKTKRNAHQAFTCAGNESAVTVMNISAFFCCGSRGYLTFFCPFLSMFYSENILLMKCSLDFFFFLLRNVLAVYMLCVCVCVWTSPLFELKGVQAAFCFSS